MVDKKRSKLPFLDSANRRVTQRLDPSPNSPPPPRSLAQERRQRPDPSTLDGLQGKGLKHLLVTSISHHHLPRAAKLSTSLTSLHDRGVWMAGSSGAEAARSHSVLGPWSCTWEVKPKGKRGAGRGAPAKNMSCFLPCQVLSCSDAEFVGCASSSMQGLGFLKHLSCPSQLFLKKEVAEHNPALNPC